MHTPLFVDQISCVIGTSVVFTTVEVVVVVVVVVLLFFFVKITVVGTTITVITTIPTMLPRIIHIFFLRVIASLKASKSNLYYSLQMTYSVIETESDADSTLLAIKRFLYKIDEQVFFFFSIVMLLLHFDKMKWN